MALSKPEWLKVRMPGGERYTGIKARARELSLHTVCEEAHCPNVGECWGAGTATFMVMGDICTRGCRFCAVKTRRVGSPLDAEEPTKLAQAIAEMKLDYVVITSVDRDDLADQGAGHFAACIREVRNYNPHTLVEVLIPDFCGDLDLLQVVLDARPDVLAHNVETVHRLQGKVRDPRANWAQSSSILGAASQRGHLCKTSIQVGHGETHEEVVATMRELRSLGVDFLTIGQYLRPGPLYLPVERYVRPEEFKAWELLGLEMGFRFVASGPLVRSSYRAGEYFIRQLIGTTPAAENQA